MAMRKIALAAAAALITGSPASGHAECAMAMPRAPACFDAESAALARRLAGPDAGGLGKDYVRALLNQRRCVNMSSVAAANEPIRVAARTRVATEEGWTPVLFLIVRNAAYGESAVWVAADYMAGSCEPNSPPAQ